MKLLIIGSLEGQIGAASQVALKRGAEVAHAGTGEEALNILRDGQGADIVFADIKSDLATFFKSLEEERISVPVYACGVTNDTRAAVAAIKAGALDYLPMPPDAELIGAVFAAVALRSSTVIFQDPAMQKVMQIIDQIAPSEANILITGESGTGKEVIARQIHARSKRAGNRFVAINCAALPETLLESELFGYEKGAFTGAVARRIGKFEEAHGGTLLLDEISEMDIRLQAKLLRAIQEKEIDRLGGKTPVKVDVRILATSNRNLPQEVEKRTFREDLYFRLNVITIDLPPLRKRKGDILPLAEYFSKKYAESNHLPPKTLTEDAKTKLLSHPFKGNVRELENIIHRAVLMTTSEKIDAASIQLPTMEGAPAPAPVDGMAAFVGKTVADVERDLILGTLRHTAGNRTHASQILGISIRTLRNKLRQYASEGMDIPEADQEG